MFIRGAYDGSEKHVAGLLLRLCCIIWLMCSVQVMAVEQEEIISPEFISGTTKVTAEELIDLVGMHDDLIIVDSRITGDRSKGFIESSISLPDIDTTCESLSKILPGKELPVLFYCNGVKCGRSGKALEIAKTCGYTNLYWFRKGFEVWKKKGFPFLQE